MDNARLINRIAVGIVVVDGPGAFDITAAERNNILAEVIEGLDWYAAEQPAAKLSFHYAAMANPSVNIVPWENANWPGMDAAFYGGIDAAVLREDNGRIYMFKGEKYVRFTTVDGGVDPGYPKPIAGSWRGLPPSFEEGIDAALWRTSNDRLYFFKGDEYVRFKASVADGVEAGYPQKIAEGWPGLPPAFQAGIDAALMRKSNGGIYMFKGDSYVRFSNVSDGVDDGYPKLISEGWHGLPDHYNSGIDAALWRDSNQAIYFFRNKRKNGHLYGTYVRFTGGSTADGDPQPIGLSTLEAEALWRDPALQSMGYATGQPGVHAYAEDIRQAANADGAIVLLLTKYPAPHGAYASGAWKRLVIRRDDFSAEMDRLVAHETGHIFGAPDEYGSSNCSCGTQHGRFFKEENGNCLNCTDALKADVGYPSPIGVAWSHPASFASDLDAAFMHDNGSVYFFKGNQYLRSTGGTPDADFPKPIAGNWGGFPAAFQSDLDAVMQRDNGKIYFFKGNDYIRLSKAVDCVMLNNKAAMCRHTPLHLGWGPFMNRIDAAVVRGDNGKLYLFSGTHYIRYTDVESGPDPEYPRRIAGNWKRLPPRFQDGIDAALWRDRNNRLYFFKGSEYVRFAVDPNDGVDDGYPKSIASSWPGLPAAFNNGIDAALMRQSNGKIYFLKGNQYARFSDAGAGLALDYIRPIAGNWPGLPEDGIDAALMRRSNGKIYFFRGTKYYRYSSVPDGVDAGYPKWIDRNWMPFPR